MYMEECMYAVCDFFFFQAEDGIRDIGVTGVQTCALPISRPLAQQAREATIAKLVLQSVTSCFLCDFVSLLPSECWGVPRIGKGRFRRFWAAWGTRVRLTRPRI